VDRWCGQWHQPRGAILPLAQGWALAQAWYREDRRAPAWRRKTAAEAEAIFAGLGLTGSFWQLRS
jgi:hypothetical protein